MSDRLTERTSAMLAINGKRDRKNVLLAIASVVIALATIYFLALPASSLTESAYCGKDAHEHGADCYSPTLICDISTDPAEAEVHSHSDACYEVEAVLSCGFDEDSSLSDASAVPNESVANPANSVGGDDASSDDGTPEAAASKEGSIDDSSHVHSDACYEQVGTLMCGFEEGEALPVETHEHAEACYEQILSCDIEEHVHSVSCYSNPNADVETSAVWEATLPSEDKLNGVWADDLIAVAESQLGYTESDKNYLVTEEGKLKGYTRYGAWYGNAYGDWCAMFVSFCLYYAGIPEDSFPREANCQKWIESLSSEDYQLYYPVGEYADVAAAAKAAADAGEEVAFEPAGVLDYLDSTEPFVPIPGDIVFFNWDADADSDHVGIVVEVIEATETEPAKIKTIEGNASDMVKYCEYELDDASIMGYAALPIKPIEEAVTFASSTRASSPTAIGSAENALKSKTLWELGNKNYQRSWHNIGGTGPMVFALVLGGSAPSNWTASPTEWSASAVSPNYIAAYCGDRGTFSSSTGAAYVAHTMNDSRYGNEERERLSAIVAHTYPFISVSQMKAEMKELLTAEEYAVVANCDASEMIAASQWAIWLTTNPTYDIGEASFGGQPKNYYGQVLNDSINRITSVSHGRNSGSESHVAAIKNYLLSKTSHQEPLDLSEWSKEESDSDGDGLYDLTVIATLNRAVAGESVTASIVIPGSDLATNAMAYDENKESFSLTMSNLTQEQLNTAQASINIEGSHIQAYWLESDGYQDLISGNNESYTRSYSVNVGEIGADGGLSVSVTKMWEGFTPGAQSVQVALLANGTQQETVTLSADNGWSYMWEGLPREDASGAVEYTVEEITSVSGYASTVAAGGLMWRKLSSDDSIVSGGQYLLLSPSGALSWTSNDANATYTGNALEWVRAGAGSVMETPRGAVWTLTADNSGAYAVSNAASGGKYLQWNGKHFTLDSSKSTIDVKKQGDANRSWWNLSSGNTYFRTLDTVKAGLGASKDYALKFQLYELSGTSAVAENGDLSFTVTNTPESSLADITLKKVSEVDTTELLAGASFDLYEANQFTGQSSGVPGIDEKVLGVGTFTTGDSGVVTIENLGLGKKYYLVETAAPEGYSLLDYPICFTVDGTSSKPEVSVQGGRPGAEYASVSRSEKGALVVKNAPVYVLPETGGVGKAALTAMGMGLVGVGVVNLVFRRKRINRSDGV